VKIASSGSSKPSGSSISYNPWTNSYAMGEGYKIDFMDANFKLIKSVSRKDYDQQGYVNQGMGSDRDFIYLPVSYSDKTKNMIIVFDWQGNQIKEVPLPEPNETESICVVGDTYYVTFYHNGQAPYSTYLHELTFEIIYEDRR
jgi:sugar lactone lactonase YvrE